MERTTKSKPLWIKISPGTLVLRALDPNRRIKPKQKIYATAEQLGKHVVEFELLEGEVEVVTAGTPINADAAPTKEEYTVDHTGVGWYNVLSPTGKVMNEGKLRAADAEKLKSELEESQEDEL